MTVLWVFSCSLFSRAQNCPPNLDFETGTFDNWTCYAGYVTGDGQNSINVTPTGPMSERHTMYSSFPGDGMDPYGGFPVNCPNGSGHSIRLGNSMGGGQAEGISYEFTIPANENYYTLIYHYAVVFQDPNHQEYQQPRLQIEVTNVTDNQLIHCSSFTFVPYGQILPGFFESPNPGSETPVWCKDWTAVSINLDGHAGKTIRMFFKTADCTFQRHFGYAYIDVNTECSGTFTGATFCPDDSFIKVYAPYGYQQYTWFNNAFTQVLGNQQILIMQPPPPAGTTIAVQLIPYNGYGCTDTLYARLIDTLTVTANAGQDMISCNYNPVPLGVPPKPGLQYQWTPSVGLTNPDVANPHANPEVSTTYYLTVNHEGGGCLDRDTVVVQASIIDDAITLLGKNDYCIGSGDSAVLRVSPTDSIQWYRNGTAISNANDVRFEATQTGRYFARLFNNLGCEINTAEKVISVSSIPVPAFSAGNGTQCLVGNRFLFSNASTNELGEMQYRWHMGNGATFSSKDVDYSYPNAGTYEVKLIVNSSSICLDSVSSLVTIHPNPVAEFIAEPICVNLPMQAINRTADTLGSPIHYTWSFGNGQTYTDRDPPPQVYTRPGTYTISLSVISDQCPTPASIFKRNIVVDEPRRGVVYPVQYAVINYPLQLQARDFGETALWSPGSNLDNNDIFNPVFTGSAEQTYTVKITTVSGCETVDTQVVKTVKDAMIYVPSAFSPNNDGLNDYLRPVFMGIRELRYFRVFNRWGQLLYQNKSELPGWDGTIGGQPQGSQVVVWMIEGVSVDNRVITMKGTSTLVR